jgi:hypothetical protein
VLSTRSGRRGIRTPIRRSLVTISLTAVALVACAPAADPEGPLPDWDDMIGNGITSTEARAEREMGFDLLVPSLLGEPTRIVITAPEAASPEFRQAGFVYGGPSHGRYWVIEAP